MFKYTSQVNGQALKRAHRLWITRNYQSSGSSTSGAKKGIAAGAILGVTIGTLGYAKYDDDYRKRIEDIVPGSSFVYKQLFGPSIHDLYDSSPIPIPQEGLLKKKLDREKKRLKEKENEKAPEPVVEKKEPEPSPESIPEKETSDEKTPASDLEIDESSSKNEALSLKLKDMMLQAQLQAENTFNSFDDMKAIYKAYLQKANEAISAEDGDKSLFEETKQLAEQKNAAMKLLDEKLGSVQKYVEDIESAVRSAKDDESTKENPTLETVDKLISDFNSARAKIAEETTELVKQTLLATELQDLIEQGRRKLEEEIKMLVPNADLEKTLKEDHDILLAHAHKRILALQKELAKHITTRQQDVPRFDDHEQRFNERRLQSELQRQEHDLALDHRHRISQMREDFESELRSQLKRQAAAHSDHLADRLLEQEKHLERIWNNRLNDSLEKEREIYLTALSKLDGQLAGLNGALETRAKIDEAAHHAHDLWMKCQSFKTSLRMGNPDSKSWEDQLRPLQNDVQALKTACGDGDSFVDAVVGSLHPEALSRGVYTESALKERFMKVERVCTRVAMVGDNGGSLIRYFVSYIRSFLLMGSFEKLPESELTEIDVDNLNAYDILARTRYCLEKDDLLQSVRYMKLLKGEAKNVAKDWIKEALLTLEAQQAADVLMSYAAATGTKAL